MDVMNVVPCRDSEQVRTAVFIYSTMAPFPIPWRNQDPHLILCSLGPKESPPLAGS